MDASATRRRRNRGIKTIPTYLLLAVVGLVFAVPIVYLFVASFAPNSQVLGGFSTINPADFSFANYERIFTYFNSAKNGYLWQFYSVTIIVTAAVVIGGLVVNSLAGYAMARMRWRGRGAILVAVALCTIVPFEAVAVPLYYMLNGQRNTIYIQALPFIASAFSIFLFYTFFLDVPKEIEEAARIDGASPLRTFVSVVVPMTRPAFATVAILTFISQWGSYLWPVIMTSNTDVRPLVVQLGVFQSYQRPEWGSVMAFGVIFILPILIIFLIFQRNFVASVANSGLKG